MNIIGVIPARYESTRFHGKPLADILGFPMIYRVYHQAIQVKELDKVYVATDDVRIEDVCKSYNIPVIMTDKNHTNGTERLCEVAKKIESDVYVTIQGDEPLLEPATISKVIKVLLENDKAGCATLKIPYHNPIDVINSTTPKVVNDLNNNVILFTRSPIPYPKASLDYIIYKPIGTYAFRRKTLLEYSKLEKGPLEKAEEIELLRYIENGIKIKIGVTNSDTIAVDTPKDLRRVIDILKNKVKKES
jgi:3-deoxy-D-manno-octulosonate cytidylyltransferase